MSIADYIGIGWLLAFLFIVAIMIPARILELWKGWNSQSLSEFIGLIIGKVKPKPDSYEVRQERSRWKKVVISLIVIIIVLALLLFVKF